MRCTSNILCMITKTLPIVWYDGNESVFGWKCVPKRSINAFFALLNLCFGFSLFGVVGVTTCLNSLPHNMHATNTMYWKNTMFVEEHKSLCKFHIMLDWFTHWRRVNRNTGTKFPQTRFISITEWIHLPCHLLSVSFVLFHIACVLAARMRTVLLCIYESNWAKQKEPIWIFSGMSQMDCPRIQCKL